MSKGKRERLGYTFKSLSSMNEEKLINYIKGEIYSDEEISQILDWIESSPENQEKYNQLKNLWVISGLDRPGDAEIPVFFNSDKKVFIASSLFQSVLKYAAVFVFAFLLGSISLYLINREQSTTFSGLYNTIEVPNGQRSQITLYDGTKVWINSGTKFKYPVAFSKDTRDVYIEGEAYFDVAKDKKHPFIVNAGRLKIKVLGTRFNVCAYPEDGKSYTTLEEGSVNAINTKNGDQFTLKPGEQVTFNPSTNSLQYQDVNTALYTSWKENMLRFDDATFAELIIKMERWYGIKITIDPSVNTKERYTMTIKTESLREMLSLISKTTQIKYEINGNSVRIKKP